jgi:hypothetical protein
MNTRNGKLTITHGERLKLKICEICATYQGQIPSKRLQHFQQLLSKSKLLDMLLPSNHPI